MEKDWFKNRNLIAHVRSTCVSICSEYLSVVQLMLLSQLSVVEVYIQLLHLTLTHKSHIILFVNMCVCVCVNIIIIILLLF